MKLAFPPALQAALPRLSLTAQAGFYFLAGVNHFVNPQFYAPLIPPYLPAHDLINAAAGLAEILLALALLHPRTRPLAAVGLIAMLLAFVPSHLYMIERGGCLGALCVGPLVAHLRLWLVHPLLLLWAWSARENKRT